MEIVSRQRLSGRSHRTAHWRHIAAWQMLSGIKVASAGIERQQTERMASVACVSIPVQPHVLQRAARRCSARSASAQSGTPAPGCFTHRTPNVGREQEARRLHRQAHAFFQTTQDTPVHHGHTAARDPAGTPATAHHWSPCTLLIHYAPCRGTLDEHIPPPGHHSGYTRLHPLGQYTRPIHWANMILICNYVFIYIMLNKNMLKQKQGAPSTAGARAGGARVNILSTPWATP